MSEKPKKGKKSLRAPVPKSQLSVPNSPVLSDVQSSPSTPTLYEDGKVVDTEDRESIDGSASSQSSGKENENVEERRRSGRNKTLPAILGKLSGL